MTTKKNEIQWLSNIPIRAVTRKWLTEQANKKGKKIGLTAGLLLDEVARDCISSMMDHDGSNSSVWNLEWFLQQELAMAHAKYAARIYLMRPTDEGMERLEIMCDEAGVLSTDTLAEVESDPFSTAVLANRATTSVSRCTEWLSGLLRQVGDEGMPSNMIYALAKEDGYSGSTLERAKRTIIQDVDSPEIEAFRDGPRWSWRIKAGE